MTKSVFSLQLIQFRESVLEKYSILDVTVKLHVLLGEIIFWHIFWQAGKRGGGNYFLASRKGGASVFWQAERGGQVFFGKPRGGGKHFLADHF